MRGKGGDGDDREDDAPLTVPWLPRPRAEEEQDTLEAVSTAAHSVVMMRHGESLFNKHNVFTGWCDVPLTEDGRREATHAGHILASHGLEVDVVFCSVLQRSSVTAQLVLEACGQSWVDVRPRWELNERHYGALQGLSKEQTVREQGEEAVRDWRSSYHSRPPPMADEHPHWDLIARDRRYRSLARTAEKAKKSSGDRQHEEDEGEEGKLEHGVMGKVLDEVSRRASASSSSSSSSPSSSVNHPSIEAIWRHGNARTTLDGLISSSSSRVMPFGGAAFEEPLPPPPLLPRTESIADTAVRVMELWSREVAPLVKQGKKVLVVAHRNSLRALIRNLEGLCDDEVAQMVIPTGKPFLYPLDQNLRPMARPISCATTNHDLPMTSAEVFDYEANSEAAAAAIAATVSSGHGRGEEEEGKQRQDEERGMGALAELSEGPRLSDDDEASDAGMSSTQASIAERIAEIRLSNTKSGNGPSSTEGGGGGMFAMAPAGCGFQGVFLEDDSQCIDSYSRGMAACLDKWAEDPAHPPDECIFEPSDDCAVEF